MNVMIWIVLGLVAWSLGLLFLMVLMRMASDEERAALRQEELLKPLPRVIDTRATFGEFALLNRGPGLALDVGETWVIWRREWRRAA